MDVMEVERVFEIRSSDVSAERHGMFGPLPVQLRKISTRTNQHPGKECDWKRAQRNSRRYRAG
ncbi:hypothetical protein DMH04_27440 [Kibdelosporangium aridum]|uniref:Uncharacterized protein n=2 Tax=Kibdelosporangium aridum TaxID=2030 RepID=A0A428Z4U3_KIBAR|nr:hypothetical protein DMH04_27440 [Kibdelosporangium aridum]